MLAHHVRSSLRSPLSSKSFWDAKTGRTVSSKLPTSVGPEAAARRFQFLPVGIGPKSKALSFDAWDPRTPGCSTDVSGARCVRIGKGEVASCPLFLMFNSVQHWTEFLPVILPKCCFFELATPTVHRSKHGLGICFQDTSKWVLQIARTLKSVHQCKMKD